MISMVPVVTVGEGEDKKPALVSAFGPELALLVVVGLWASTFIVTKDLYDTLTPLAFTGVRFWLMDLLQLGGAGGEGDRD